MARIPCLFGVLLGSFFASATVQTYGYMYPPVHSFGLPFCVLTISITIEVNRSLMKKWWSCRERGEWSLHGSHILLHMNHSAHMCGRELRTQNSKSHLSRTLSLKVLLLKPGVGQYIAIHATLTVRNFFLANFYLRSIHLHFFQNLSRAFFVLAVANTGSCVSPQNTTGQPAHSYR